MISLLLLILTFVELNCENLFDTAVDTTRDNNDYTPTGLYRWTPHRYWCKINNIAQEILSCGDRDSTASLPDVVALIEVENDSVLYDLTRRSPLRNAHYEYLCTSSEDVRGINVALLYSPMTFHVDTSYAIRIVPLPSMRPTRDILYVKGTTAMSDTLHLFVVHAPSRLGGEYQSRPHRKHVINRLALSIDSIQALSPEAKIMCMGDFNDVPHGHSLTPLDDRQFIDLGEQAHGTHGAKGTYKYKETWDTIDHIFLSPHFTTTYSCFINDIYPLITKDHDYSNCRPNRNYLGLRWMNAYSDHLPLVADITL